MNPLQPFKTDEAHRRSMSASERDEGSVRLVTTVRGRHARDEAELESLRRDGPWAGGSKWMSLCLLNKKDPQVSSLH